MKAKIIKSMLVHMLGISTIVTVVPMATACGEKKVEPPKEEIIKVQKIELDKSTLELNVGQTANLIATITPENVTNKKVTWESSYPDIASVDENGKVTALKDGDTDIIVITDDGERTATCEVVVKHVEIPVTGVKLNEHTINLNEGDAKQLTATISPTNATNKNVTWQSSNPSIATIDSDGTIHALKEGTTTIIVITNDGSKTDECEVTVKNPIIPFERIDLESALELVEGQTHQLIVTITPKEATNNVIWTSSNETVATVDKNGLVTALKAGTAIITATADDSSGIKAKCTVTIKAPIVLVESIKLESTLALAEGETNQLIAKVLPEDATNKNIIWTSNNETVATVNKNGRVTALKVGFATITATSAENKEIKATCEITVKLIQLNKETLKLNVGDSEQLTATVLSNDATNNKVTWSSSNEEVATVDETGLVKALTPGYATITASTMDGVKTSANVVSTKVLLNYDAMMLVASKETRQLTATVLPKDISNKKIVWTSSNPEIATVDQNGLVTAYEEGTATITATTEDGGEAASCIVHALSRITWNGYTRVDGISFDKSELLLDADSYEYLNATISPADASYKSIWWTSSNPNVAFVDPLTGRVYALKPGTVTITATTWDKGFKATCKVTVTNKNYLKLNSSELKLIPETNYLLKETFDPQDATNQKIIWTSSDPEAATVDKNKRFN